MTTSIHRARVDSPLGVIHLAATEKGLAALYFDPQVGDIQARLESAFGAADSGGPEPRALAETRAALERYFAGDLTALAGVALDPFGTDFEKSVWSELHQIAPGETRAYGEIARRLGRPQAARAVGRAIGRNPISLFIPCHRAVGAYGSLTGFAGGLERKEKLLRHEGALEALPV
jgi:methylated-DNA-[protein]-cysteine S-methyltransferase